MRKGPIARVALAGLMTLGFIAAAAPASGPAALAMIEPGEWQLKESGMATSGRSLCIADPQILIQLQHPGARCSRFTVDDTPSSATVHYTCPSAGHGRTTIRVESATVIHVQTQGIADGAPFEFDYEGRRTGACSGAGTSR